MKSLGRRGVELAAGVVVILIVSMVILGLALSMTYRVLCAAESFSSDVDSQTRGQIDRLLSSGGAVVVGDNTQDAKAHGSMLCGGSRQRSAVFTLGIQNQVLGSEGNFFLTISEVGNDDPPEGVYFLADEGGNKFVIPPGERRMITIMITDEGSQGFSGQKVYSATVRRGAVDGTFYGVQQLYVRFP